MSKFIILGDLHAGARSASQVVCEYQLRYFEIELFPYMKKHGIKTILQLGDLFDTRKFSNHEILHQWKSRFFNVIEDNGFKLITLIGNHDSAFKNTLDVNSTSLFLSSYNSIEIIDEPTVKNICDIDFLLVPWICADNKEAVSKIVNDCSAIFCAGHFEFSGFDMQKGVVANGGDDAAEYSKFDLVISGHYHTRSMAKNILYTGIPFELTWADHNDQKGFHVFDSATQKIKFVESKLVLFKRLEYNDKLTHPIDETNLGGKYVKVVVVNKSDPHNFEKFIAAISLQNPADLTITDIEVDFDSVDIEDDNIAVDDTITLITKFIDQTDTTLNKSKIKDMMKTLYINALEITI